MFCDTTMTKQRQISLRLPSKMIKELEDLSEKERKDRSEVIRELLTLGIQEKKLRGSIELYRGGRATLWKAAKLAGLSLWEMIEVLKERKIEAQYGIKELEEDLRALTE